MNIRTGELIWISGPVPGSVHDMTLFELSNFSQQLFSNELILGDKAYVGHSQIITPIKGAKTITEYQHSN
jgi:hypothetical protein